MDENEFAKRQTYTAQQNVGISSGIAMAAEPRQRSPYQIGDDLHRLSDKFSGPTEEHRLLREAAQCIVTLLSDVQRAEGRAERSEETATVFNAKIKLAKLALDAVHPS